MINILDSLISLVMFISLSIQTKHNAPYIFIDWITIMQSTHINSINQSIYECVYEYIHSFTFKIYLYRYLSYILFRSLSLFHFWRMKNCYQRKSSVKRESENIVHALNPAASIPEAYNHFYAIEKSPLVSYIDTNPYHEQSLRLPSTSEASNFGIEVTW